MGLKKDIQTDTQEMIEVKESFVHFKQTYTYLSNLEKSVPPNLDSLNKYTARIKGNAFLKPHQNRFNGFVSAGKYSSLEDDSLSLLILNYYQEVLPSVKLSETAWAMMNKNLNEYLTDNLEGESPHDYFKVLTRPKARHLCRDLIPWEQLGERQNMVIEEGQKIINRIDALYPPET